MPIDRKQFDKGEFKARRYPSREEHPIAKLLQKNPGLAFRVDEISKRLKMSEDTIRSMLSKLKEEGFVEHKSPYYAWKKRK